MKPRAPFAQAALAMFVFSGALVGCDDDAPPFTPPSFDRADQVALACIDVVRDEGLPLADCEGGDATEDRHLIALVTQSQRGELAVVDLDEEILIDVDPQVPGYTFHPVGELPTGVAVSPDGTRAYVTCSGSNTLSVLDIGTIFAPEGRLDDIDLGAHRPFDIVADDARLFVTAPEEGLLLAVDPESGDVTELTLAAATGGGGGDADAGAGDDAGAVDAGTDDAGADDAGAGADGGAAGADDVSRPWRMAVDLDERRLYVANAGLPFVSVVDIDAFTELEALAIGAPTTSLAVSPVRAEGTGTRWLYAVERAEGGVRVMNLGTGLLVDTNHGTYERDGVEIAFDDPRVEGPAIQVPGNARAVEIFSRGSDADAAPEVLDGMFAAIASSSGRLYIVDIEDDDAEARAESEDEIGYAFLPHHLPVLERLTSAALPQLANDPLLEVASTQVICGNDYSFVAHFGPDAPVCDDPGAELQVLQDYPWAATNEEWTVTFEGTIPGTVRPRGNLEGDDQVLDAGADFCALGVEPGDRFTLDVDPEETIDPACGDADARARGWEIAEVFENHLVLAEPFGIDLQDCGLDDWVDYRVRTSGVWTVVGEQSGFLHHVIAEGEGDDRPCIQDPSADPRLVARAPELDPGESPPAGECSFENTTLCFTIVRGRGAEEQTLRTLVDTEWSFETDRALVPLAILDVGSLPTAVRYLSERDTMVIVDPVDEGLVEVSMSSLEFERAFR